MSCAKRGRDWRRCPEWSDLPIELVAVIANHVKSIHDYLSFRGVCNLWRSAATFDNFDSAFPRVPWLMYVTREKKEKGFFGPYDPRIANFLDLVTNKTYKSNNFPSTSGTAYVPSIGWILSISGYNVYLTHPVWRIRMELPGLNTFNVNEHRNHPLTAVISKMVLSGSPTLKADLVIMVIWGRQHQLAFCRPGDSHWTVLASWKGSFSDIIYHNRRLYGLDNSRRVVECNIYGPNPTQIRQVFSLPSLEPALNVARRSIEKLYLLETSGKFLIVSQLFNIFKTLSFRVFEVDLTDGSHNEVHDIGKKALFLGFNSSICLDLTAVCNQNEVKANCIYFTSHLGVPEYKAMNVYCLSNASFNTSIHGLPDAICAPVTWVLPSL